MSNITEYPNEPPDLIKTQMIALLAWLDESMGSVKHGKAKLNQSLLKEIPDTAWLRAKAIYDNHL